jgi:hypothetical protein
MEYPVMSRYHNTPTVQLGEDEQKPIIYLQRRFLPPIEPPIVPFEHTVSGGERLDNLTASYLGDPEQFWRICDVNPILHPDELISEVGQRIRIPSLGES